ncbi:MAG: flagellar protein FlaG [Thermodesulfobacteriota bacterium]|nr:flagellar protein FlaG [Thermodesulfobacteriota bacterium]
MNIAEISTQYNDISPAAMKIVTDKKMNSSMIQERVIKKEEKTAHVPASPQKTEVDTKNLQKTLEHVTKGINEFMNKTERHLSFHIHKETGKLTVQVIRSETGEIIREVPPGELLDIAARIQENLGVLFDIEV